MSLVGAAMVMQLLQQAAAPAPVVWGLTWVSPPDCIRPADLAERLEAASDRRAVFGANAALRLEGRVAPEASGWRARLTLVDKQGTVMGNRELQSEASDCRAIDDRLELVAGLLMETALKPAAPMPPAPEVVTVPRKPTLPAFEVYGERHLYLGQQIGLEGFYRRLGRLDLVDDLQARQVKRAVGFSLSGVALAGGAVLLTGYAFGLGCTYAVSGASIQCTERPVGLAVASVVLLVAGAVGLIATSTVDPLPTTLVQDAALAAAANGRP